MIIWNNGWNLLRISHSKHRYEFWTFLPKNLNLKLLPTLKYLITDRMELPTKRSLLAKNNKRPECNKQPEGQIWKFDKQPSCNLLEFGHEYKPKVQNTEPFSTAMGFTMLLAGHLVKVLSNLPKRFT